MDAAFERRSMQAFDAVLDQPDEDRERWITEHYSADPELLVALRRLLEADRRHAQALPTAVPQARPLAPEMTPPARVGVWRLISCLGRGGMGQVYLGERDDGLFEQKVAIKLMAPGMFPAAAAQLFDNERRVLARLRHPHIAQIYDGGVTPEEKLPFFAMELVEGEPIDRYCIECDLPLDKTLRLFLDVCDAVRHAHQNLVVHADLKPSNIHVDRAGQVKLLDFGIARLVAQGSDPTQDLPQPLTPAYASPGRQAGEPATPADDVYSLGVVLFELLVGVRPGSPHIAASETVMAGDRPLSQRRKRARLLRGDLDAIIARALAANPQPRYPSVDALVTDLERWRLKLPVNARRGGWTYRARKFLLRNRLAVSIGIAAVSGLSLALAVTIQLYLRAETARTLAEQRFDDVRSLSRFMLFELFDSLGALPGTSTIRRDIADAGRGYLERLAADPDAPIDVRFDVASGYSRLGQIKASTSGVGTGDLEVGHRNLLSAERLLRELVASAPERTDFALELAKTLVARSSIVASSVQDLDAEERLARESLVLFDDLLRRTGADPQVRFWRWNARLRLAEHLYERAQYASIIELLEEDLRSSTSLRLPEAMAWRYPMLLAATHDRLGNSWYYSGDVALAVSHFENAMLVWRASPLAGRDVRYINGAAFTRYNLAETLQEVGRAAEGLAVLDEGLAEIARAMAFESSPNLESSQGLLALTRAVVLSKLGRHEEAVAQAREEVTRRERRAAEHPADYNLARETIVGYQPLGRMYAQAGLHAQACAAYRTAAAGWKALEKMSPTSAFDAVHDIPFIEEQLKGC